MVAKHNFREFSNHTHSVIRPSYEYCGVEIFCFDHQLTKVYTPSDISKGENYKLTSHRHLKSLVSNDSSSSFAISMNYNCTLQGEYQIDILYENKNSKDYTGKYEIEYNTTKTNYINTKKILNTETQITKLEKQIKEIKQKISKTNKTINSSKSNKTTIKSAKLNLKTLEKALKNAKKKLSQSETTLHTYHRLKGKDLKFDGEKDWLKRKTIYTNLQQGTNTLYIEIPYNCYFLGAMIRRVITLKGDSEDSTDTVLMLESVEFTESGKTDPVEAKIEIGYDNIYENQLSESGYYMDYEDEVNIYVKEDAEASNTKHIRRFGGYITGFSLDENKSILTINCSDRLQDGENKYMLATMLILKGTGSTDEEKYYNPINFNSYGEALKYVCNAYEKTLKSNISKNYLVDGEKYNSGQSIKFGKKKDIKKVTTVNASAKVEKNFVTVRNNSNGKKQQSITLYNAKDHVKKYPICLREVKNGQPVESKELLTFHMTYGLGDPKTDSQSTTIESSSGGVGSQKFTKCGVSQDGKYVMGIGQRGVGKGKDKYPYGTYYKTIFKNKCPYCKKATLRWDSCRTDSKCIRGGTKRNFPVPANETEITCESCDCDFDVPTGYSKEGKYKYKLTKVGSTVKSSKSEQNKLHKGNMTAVAKSGVSVSPSTVLKEIAKIAKQYKYERNSTTTYSAMKKSGKGDCHAFSDLIFTELKKRKVNCRILQYSTSMSNTHRSVQYMNSKNQWVSFPYKKYGLSGMLVQTSNWKSGAKKPFKLYNAGGNISGVVSSKSNGTSTSTVTYTYGYDRDKPIQCYIEITFSIDKSLTAKKYKINLDFTLKAGTNNDWSGLPNYWVNNSQRQVSVDMKGFFDDNYKGKSIYLQSIRLVAPKIKTTSTNDSADWYTNDKSTVDNSSCKMDLYQIIFDNKPSLNPTDLQSTGKSLNSILEDLVKDSGYLVHREYGKHRYNDEIFFSVDNQTTAKFTATEGDENNILEWSNISFNPVSSLRNKSVCVFKQADSSYAYVDTGDLKSILKYGEQTVLTTISDQISSKEAYFNAKNSEEYNPEQDFSYTIIVPYAPNLHLGDLVEVISNNHVLNDVKPVESIKVSWNNKRKPCIRTELGLGELEPYLRIRKSQEKLRKQAKSKTTYFGRTATAIEDEEIYIWDN